MQNTPAIQPFHANYQIIAVAPLVGNQQSDEANWLGALLSSLLIEHLSMLDDVELYSQNGIAQAIIDAKYALPLEDTSVADLLETLSLDALIQGRYVLDEDGAMLALRLVVEGDSPSNTPLEAATPLASFPRFIERISLALIDRLGFAITDQLRRQINKLERPSNFEAFRQLARAHAAWSRGENELARTAVTSALSLDPNLEAAMVIETAIAREAQDTQGTQQAFKRWADHAAKRGNETVAAERLTMLGHWLAERGYWNDAQRTYDEARKLYTRAESEIGEARTANNIANLQLMRGRTIDGIRTYRRNMRVFEITGEADIDLAISYLNVAMAHKNQGQREEAKQAIDEALKRAEQLDHTFLQGHCYMQRGALHDDFGEWSAAERDYKHAKDIFVLIDDKLGQALVTSYQGLLLRQRGAYDPAEKAMAKALQMLQHLGTLHEEAVARYNLSDLYAAMGQFEKAWEYANRSYEMFVELKSGWVDTAKDLKESIEDILEEIEAARRIQETRASQATTQPPEETPQVSPQPDDMPPPDEVSLYPGGPMVRPGSKPDLPAQPDQGEDPPSTESNVPPGYPDDPDATK